MKKRALINLIGVFIVVALVITAWVLFPNKVRIGYYKQLDANGQFYKIDNNNEKRVYIYDKNKKEHIICLKILLIGNIIMLMRRNHVELEKLEIEGLNDVYALSVVKKEFKKAVDEPWRDEKPLKRYQKTLLQDLAVLDAQKEKAIVFEQFELLSGTENLYSIRHPKTQKNVRVLYTFTERLEVVLLVAFLEKSTSDYQNAMRTASSRLKWLKS